MFEIVEMPDKKPEESVYKKVLSSMREAFTMTKQRCYNPKCRDYIHYGGRGITVCDRWLESFDNFVTDMGLRPEGMTLERLDNDGPYGPGNCVWETRQAQAMNRRCDVSLTYEGKTQSLQKWAEETGIAYHTLKTRVGQLGYSAEEALTKPVVFGGKLPGKLYKVRRSPDMSKIPKGVNSQSSKLSKADVLEMQRLNREEGVNFSQLAKKFSICVQTASNVAQRKGPYHQGSNYYD